MAGTEEMTHYCEWLATLSDEELENERFTVENEWRVIGMRETDALDQQYACRTETERRNAARQ